MESIRLCEAVVSPWHGCADCREDRAEDRGVAGGIPARGTALGRAVLQHR